MKKLQAVSIQLEVFKNLLNSIPEEMGVVLKKSSFSPNIKERLDFSCALFNSKGELIAQAAHIPVHLGAMPLSIVAAMKKIDFSEGDMVILNDPFQGGTHLPDITIIAPIFHKNHLFGFAANRAHHADIGGMTPGSMPIATEIFQEGLILPPVKLIENGELNQSLWKTILSNVRTPIEREGDLNAQLAANKRGQLRCEELLQKYGVKETNTQISALIEYSEKLTRKLIQGIPNGDYSFIDYLEDDGISDIPIPITVKITIMDENAIVDFTGSAPQQQGSINAVLAITHSAVYYVFRCLFDIDIPNNSGCMAPIKIVAPTGTVVNAIHPSPVAGGNVETSQRIVDVLLGALSKAVPEKIPAASQGTMNNILIGGWDSQRNRAFSYYETIGGGMGASQYINGASAIHSHMTNTLNTPIEALEFAYPLEVLEYSIRKSSGGKGKHKGGDGIRRDIKVHEDASLSLLTERRKLPPYSLAGGEPGGKGNNILIRNKRQKQLPGKGNFSLKAGDVISIRTPGGGGYGKIDVKKED